LRTLTQNPPKTLPCPSSAASLQPTPTSKPHSL